MFQQFNTYITKILKTYKKKKARFYHWGNAEVSLYNNFKDRHRLSKGRVDITNTSYQHKHIKFNNDQYDFYDLHKIFISEPIFIKGVLNYSLKNIAKALYNYKIISSCWNLNSPCSNGLSAMILANKIYNQQKMLQIDTISKSPAVLYKMLFNEPIMKDIIYYNEIDCKVLYEIHTYIKKC